MGNCTHRDCFFHSRRTDTCDYYIETGERRGCPAGCCDKYRPGSREGKAPGVPSAARESVGGSLFWAMWSLYLDGRSDSQIAGELNVSVNTVARWRRREMLPGRAARREDAGAGRGCL